MIDGIAGYSYSGGTEEVCERHPVLDESPVWPPLIENCLIHTD